MSYKTYLYKTIKQKNIQINEWLLFGYSILTLLAISAIFNLVIFLIPETDIFIIGKGAAAILYPNDPLFIFFIVIIFPLIEELAFSFFLGKKKYQIIVSVSLLLGLLITTLNFAVFKELEFSLFNFFLVWLGSSLFTSLWVAFPAVTNISFAENVYRIIKNDERPLNYFFSFIFAGFQLYLIHKTLYPISLSTALFLLLFYFVFRLIINQIRISKNFLLAVGFHSLFCLWIYWEMILS